MNKLIAAAALATLTAGAAIAQNRPAPDAGADAPRMSKMARADRNGDGFVSRDEAMAHAARQFDRKDRNKDGRLDQTELAAKPHRGHRMAAN